MLQDAGWETSGLEPGARQARVAARRHRMVDAVPSEEGFDLVLVNHVLEHLLDPLTTVRELARSLVPGGQLFVSVPDLGRVHLHRDLTHAASDMHLSSYTFSGMRSVLALGGFEVEEHFEGPEWAELDGGSPTRLRVLARRSEHVRFPVEEAPLDQAVRSLRELGRFESHEEAERRRAERASFAVAGPEAPSTAPRRSEVRQVPGASGADVGSASAGSPARRALRRLTGRAR